MWKTNLKVGAHIRTKAGLRFTVLHEPLWIQGLNLYALFLKRGRKDPQWFAHSAPHKLARTSFCILKKGRHMQTLEQQFWSRRRPHA